MARRRKTSVGGGPVIILVLIGAAACVAFYFVIPLAVIVWWVTSECLAFPQRALRTKSDVGPTGSEAVEAGILDHEIAARTSAMASTEDEGDRNALRRRSDGMFDERSYLGRDLNVRLTADRRQLIDAVTARDRLSDVVQGRIDKWARHKAMVAGSRAGTVTFVVVGATLAMQPAAAASVGGLNFIIGETDLQTRTLLGAIAIAGSCALAVNLAAFKLRQRDLLG